MQIIKKGNTQKPWLYGTCAVCGCIVRCKDGDAAIIPSEMCSNPSPSVECPTSNCGEIITLNRTTEQKSLSEEFEDFFCDKPTPKPPFKTGGVVRKKPYMLVGDERPKWPPSRVAQDIRDYLKGKNELSEEADKL